MIKTTIGFALLATTFLSSAASAFDITTDDLLEKLSNSPNVSWEEVGEDKKDETDVIAVNLPNDQTKYFRYTYSKPDGYEVITKPELMLPTIPTLQSKTLIRPAGWPLTIRQAINMVTLPEKFLPTIKSAGN